MLVGAALVGGASSGQAEPGGPAPSTPRTSAEALTQLRDFNHKFEQVTEQYNEAQILLGQRRVAARKADQRARAAAARYQMLDGQVHRVVVAASQTEPFGKFAAMFSSGSPQQFVERLKALDIVATRRGALLQEAGRSQAEAAKARAEAKAAVAAAARLTRELAAKKADLSDRAAKSKAMFERLSARERQAFLANAHAAAERASRAAPRETAPAESAGPTAAPAVNVPASGRAAAAVAAAKQQLGKPYVWAAAGPGAFDCSGLTMYAWGQAGVALPHSSRMQISVGSQVSRSALQPGDLVFFYSPISHVGLYVGGGQMIHAPTSGDVVKYASIDSMGSYAGASRPG